MARILGSIIHTALEQIKYQWKSVKWFIEFDIKGFFDNVNHDILIELLEKKIDDNRFIKLIKVLLKAGYIEDFVYNKTYSGTPQGGIISPILSNIYLHELDTYMDWIISKFDRGKLRPKNLKYASITNEIYRLRKSLKEKGSNVEQISRLKALQKLQKTLPSQIESTDEYRRLRYCRYADDFICGVVGSYADAKDIMRAVKVFIQKLDLELSPEKTGIKRGTKFIEFLGYNIKVLGEIREKKVKMRGVYTTRRSVGNIFLSIPKSKVISFCHKNDYGIWHERKATHRGKLITSADEEIMSSYNDELRGFARFC